jgi:glycerol-3-phosphate dehydrogenase
LTTFRAFGEQVADKILNHLARPRSASSAALPIGGGKNYPTTEAQKSAWLSSIAEKTGSPVARLAGLLERYGTRAEAVARFMSAAPDQPLRSLPEFSRREIQFLASYEHIVHLDDLILRRTIMALLGQLSLALLEELTEVLSPVLGWSQERAREEVARTVKLLAEVHGVKLN